MKQWTMKELMIHFHNQERRAYYRGLMSLISELRTEPLFKDYYVAKKQALKYWKFELIWEDNKWYFQWNPKTVEELMGEYENDCETIQRH
jgi:hypothetical protein